MSVYNEKRQSLWLETWHRLRKNKAAVIGLVILVFLILVAIFADVIAPYDFRAQDLNATFVKPNSTHWFGTDNFGRDIFSRVVYGSRISLQIGFIAVGIALFVGGFIGAVSGYFGGIFDTLFMRLVDVMLAVPTILLAISIVAVLGPGITNLMIAVGVSSIPSYARIVRANVMSIKEMQYIEAARAMGTTNVSIILKHVIPNTLAPVIVQSTIGVAGAILSAAGLGFIGLGIQPPNPEWGSMLNAGRHFIRDHPHLTTYPGLAIMITILSLNLLGDGLRDVLDPKLKD
ncbi:MAG: ABC transporter permease [Erysipelothrix sp.]|jgi:peptide/nickel transport system permease protein|nr:ABC transporter permease [Erysipelothrix sp.]